MVYVCTYTKMNGHDSEQFLQRNFQLFLGIQLWMIVRAIIKVTKLYDM
jgi:hypothetical protein